ncbi:hypothetical protein [Kibdelosporangium phytohabitans]|uniref:Uncharacterized protein n=1 Tax=Kibdelosporangium phytohabitans TaxID=860235 RepID=A0A0N9HW60_9PSEU|nr:hypothetical protein [Kibdelosporangium phytohabitans]ALG06362.1 hypothetical protein AOZ06_04985 [Kibdelosporangium phytohabitans]MBE1467505.1 hypothetical protein [Kibdelosporangium phytohabitans]
MTVTPRPDGARIPFAERELPDTPLGILPSNVLVAIAGDAARRAAALLDSHGSELHDDVVDLVRLIQESRCDASTAAAAAERAGLSSAALSRLRVAYTFAGLEGVHTAHCAHDPVPGLMDTAIEMIRRQHNTPEDTLTVARNHLTVPGLGIQIRLSVNAQWFPYTSSGQGWAPARGQFSSPVDAYEAALGARRARLR